jgi:hypothetical protein
MPIAEIADILFTPADELRPRQREVLRTVAVVVPASVIVSIIVGVRATDAAATAAADGRTVAR